MKIYFRKIISFFVVASILFSTTGVVVASHICSYQKKAQVSVFVKENCCQDETEGCASDHESNSQIKAVCCQLDISYHKLDVLTLIKSTSSNFFNDVVAVVHHSVNFVFSAFKSVSAFLQVHSPPVMEYGKNLLHKISLLQI